MSKRCRHRTKIVTMQHARQLQVSVPHALTLLRAMTESVLTRQTSRNNTYHTPTTPALTIQDVMPCWNGTTHTHQGCMDNLWWSSPDQYQPANQSVSTMDPTTTTAGSRAKLAHYMISSWLTPTITHPRGEMCPLGSRSRCTTREESQMVTQYA